MHVDVLVCDAATVREGLLHALGAGITKIWRDEYPGSFGVDLALLATMGRGDVNQNCRLVVSVRDEAGLELAGMDGTFTARPGAELKPGESAMVPIILTLKDVDAPEAGTYTIEVQVNSDPVRLLTLLAGYRKDMPKTGGS